MRTLLAFTVLFLASPGQGSSQEILTPNLLADSRIRITDHQGEVQEGLFLAVQDHALLWKPGATWDSASELPSVTLPLDQVIRLEASLGTEPYGWKAVAITSGVLAVAGAGMAAILWEPPDEKDDPLSEVLFNTTRGPATLLGAMSGALVGAVIGGAIGWLGEREIWKDVGIRGR